MDPYSGGEVPYFFEKYFPANYHLTFHAPLHRHPGSFGISREELERRSQISKDKFEVFVDVKEFKVCAIIISKFCQ